MNAIVPSAEVSTGQPLYYGQSAAFVDQVRSAGDVVRSLCGEAEKLLRQRPPALF